MIQILYTCNSSYDKTNSNENDFTIQQETNDIPPKAKIRRNSACGMVITSLILTVTLSTALLVGLGSWNMVSQAKSQGEQSISQLPKEAINVSENVKQMILAAQDNILEEAEVAEKKLVIKKAIASNGKSYDAIAYLSIPSLGIHYPVLATTSTELLKVSLNKYWGANPNQVGNLCIVGHNYNDSRFFGKLNKIKQGAEIVITEMDGEALSYYVYQTDMVNPYDTSCTSQKTEGRKEITLITCNFDGSQRFVVKARANE